MKRIVGVTYDNGMVCGLTVDGILDDKTEPTEKVEFARVKDKCHFTDSDGNEIAKCVVCGVELSPHEFTEAETLYGEKYTVHILECKKCGCPSFGWWKVEE